MNLAAIYELLDKGKAPRHAKEVIGRLLTQSTCQMTPEAFNADRDMCALAELKLVTLEGQNLVVTDKAYRMAGIS